MTTRKKIAICYSGQTRHLNEYPEFTDDWYNILGLFNEFDCDLYGHTWEDQATPNDDILKNFKVFEKTNQDDIWDTIKLMPNLGFWDFMPEARDWHLKQEYQDIINNKGDFITFAKARINGTLGQLWSAHECFHLIKADAHWPDYEYVVRLRWDLNSKFANTTQNQIMLLRDQFKDALRNYARDRHQNPLASTRTARYGDFNSSDVLTTDILYNGNNNTPFVNDHVFVIKGISFLQSRISKKTPIEVFSHMARNTNCGFPTSHTLWVQWFEHFNLHLQTALPDITSGNGSSDGKENKYWRI